MTVKRGQAATLNLTLESDVRSARTARGAVMRLLGDEPPVEFVRDAVLLTSELISNAVTHSTGACELAAEFRASDGQLRVEVTDDSSELPSMPEATDKPSREGRLGLLLVDEVATAWGAIERPDGGKRVWFELAIEPEPAV